MKSTMRIKLKPKDIDHDRYIGVCRIIEIFDDIAEELLIRNEGHNGRLKEYKELTEFEERIPKTSTLNLVIRRRTVSKDNKNVDDYFSLIRENYDSRKSELFIPKTEEVLSKLLV